MARRLLKDFMSLDRDPELADRALRQSLSRIDWDRVDGTLKTEWIDAASARESDFPLTAEALASFSESSTTRPAGENSLELLTSWVNARLRGQVVDPELPVSTKEIQGLLQRIRDDAANGRFSVGGPEIAEVLAAILSLGQAESLWPELVGFLTDSRVSRDDRTRAFDRLARDATPVPTEHAGAFRDSAADILESSSSRLEFHGDVVPYPAALRFLSVNGFIDRSVTYGHIARLFGQEDLQGRREAAWTAATLSARGPSAELLALALPMSHDSDVVVRARASVVLAQLSSVESPLAPLAGERIGELLAEDGIEVPLSVVRALSDASVDLGEAITAKLSELSNVHPARSVRLAAQKALVREV
ncbi:hypothetical protein ACFQ80_16490 [Isoptericola sp. NPDC056578]|uniref:hypothetical protein n=1 Tax=Isoptericola sp. NPDC056578 TaxID=3345870 RepID=UPI00368E845B